MLVGCCSLSTVVCGCSYGNIKQQHYKVETESKEFDNWCKRNAVSICCMGCCL